jgi:hypothetical protein
MILSKGFVYRLGVRIKDVGERMAHVQVFGFHILRWCCGPVISSGYKILDLAWNMPISSM